jgi:katanin p60 ATPase-containing subunit A1
MQAILRDCPRDVLSLAQGIVHWSPPEQALARAEAAVRLPQTSLYGADGGDVELVEALKAKLARENGIVDSDVMVTTGANQAYTNCVLALTDAREEVVLFRPYYFNHLMAHQMTGSADHVRFGPTRPGSMRPDIDWLVNELDARPAIKVVTLCNPCNPTGVVLERADVERASEACARNGATLILDNTYEYFLAPGHAHVAIEAPHVVNIFSFSKVSVLLCTVTYYANRAHNLTRSL